MTKEEILAMKVQFNDSLAFSIIELVDRITSHIWVVRYFKAIRALARLERKGLIESKHIGCRKYYRVRSNNIGKGG